MNHTKSNNYRPYLPRSNRGWDLTQLEMSHKTLTIGLTWYLILEFIWWSDASTSFKTWKRKRFTLCCKKARKFAPKIDLYLETELNGGDEKHENAQKLKKTATEKEKKASNTTWKAKALQSKYPLQCQNTDADLHDNHQWLTSAGFK